MSSYILAQQTQLLDNLNQGIFWWSATLVVLAFFVVDTFRNAPQTFTAIVVIALLAVILDVIWKRARGDQRPMSEAPASPPPTG